MRWHPYLSGETRSILWCWRRPPQAQSKENKTKITQTAQLRLSRANQSIHTMMASVFHKAAVISLVLSSATALKVSGYSVIPNSVLGIDRILTQFLFLLPVPGWYSTAQRRTSKAGRNHNNCLLPPQLHPSGGARHTQRSHHFRDASRDTRANHHTSLAV